MSLQIYPKVQIRHHLLVYTPVCFSFFFFLFFSFGKGEPEFSMRRMKERRKEKL